MKICILINLKKKKLIIISDLVVDICADLKSFLADVFHILNTLTWFPFEEELIESYFTSVLADFRCHLVPKHVEKSASYLIFPILSHHYNFLLMRLK